MNKKPENIQKMCKSCENDCNMILVRGQELLDCRKYIKIKQDQSREA